MGHWACPSTWLMVEGLAGAGQCMKSLVTLECQASSPWFPEMARRSGSLRLPRERAASRANDWQTSPRVPNPGFIPDLPTCLVVQSWAHYLSTLSLDFLNNKMYMINVSGFFKLKCNKVHKMSGTK